MRLEITDDLIDALVDAQDETLVALRAALVRELARDDHLYDRLLQDLTRDEQLDARVMMLRGIPVARPGPASRTRTSDRRGYSR